MKLTYEKKVNQMIEYYQAMRKPFRWENDLVRHLLALTYAMKGKDLNPEPIKEMKDYIKQTTGLFSPFRGHMMFALSGLLCANSNTPQRQFDQMLKHQQVLKDVGFKHSTYLPTALYALSSVYEGPNVASYAEKAMAIYQEMKQNHPFLTSGDDYALAILLASTDHRPDLLEDYYQALNRRGFSKSNGLQMLSHVMAFSDKGVTDAADQCERINNHLKANKLKVYSDYYPSIGLISLLSNTQDHLMGDLVEVTTYLRGQKGYKWLGKGMNLLIASAIISSEYIKENSQDTVVDTTISISIQAIIAAQQAAMIAAITASTAASTNTGN